MAEPSLDAWLGHMMVVRVPVSCTLSPPWSMRAPDGSKVTVTAEQWAAAERMTRDGRRRLVHARLGSADEVFLAHRPPSEPAPESASLTDVADGLWAYHELLKDPMACGHAERRLWHDPAWRRQILVYYMRYVLDKPGMPTDVRAGATTQHAADARVLAHWLPGEERLVTAQLEHAGAGAGAGEAVTDPWDQLLGASTAAVEAARHCAALWQWYLRTCGSTVAWPPLPQDRDLKALGRRLASARRTTPLVVRVDGVWQSPRDVDEAMERAAGALPDLEDLGQIVPRCMRPVFAERRGGALKEKERLAVATLVHALAPDVTDDRALASAGDMPTARRAPFLSALARARLANIKPTGCATIRAQPDRYPTLRCPYESRRECARECGMSEHGQFVSRPLDYVLFQLGR